MYNREHEYNTPPPLLPLQPPSSSPKKNRGMPNLNHHHHYFIKKPTSSSIMEKLHYCPTEVNVTSKVAVHEKGKMGISLVESCISNEGAITIDHGGKGSAGGSRTHHDQYGSEESIAALCRNDNFIHSYYENVRGKGVMEGQMMVMRSNKKLCSRGHWKPSEDSKLRELIDIHGPHNWNLIAQKLGGRSGKSCRLRWCNQLDPSINRRAFSEGEEERLMAAHRMYGNKWSMIARLFPGRTDNSVKNHWHVVMARMHRHLHPPTVSNMSRKKKVQMLITSQYQTAGLISRSINDQSSSLLATTTCSYAAIAQPTTPNLMINSSHLFSGYKRGWLDTPKSSPKTAGFNSCKRRPSPIMDVRHSSNELSQFSFASTLASTSQVSASSFRSTSASLVSENTSASSFEKPTHYPPFIDFLGGWSK